MGECVWRAEKISGNFRHFNPPGRFISDETQSYLNEKYDSVSQRSQIMCKIRTYSEDDVSAAVLKYDTELTQIAAIVNLRDICEETELLGGILE